MSYDLSGKLKRYNYLNGELEATYHEMAMKLGLSDSAMRILYAICDNGADCPLQKIRRLSGLSKQTVNSALRKLEQDGIVYLESLGSKNKNVLLTESGRLLAKQTAGRILALENDIFASWPPEDVEKYISLTEAYLCDLRRKACDLPDSRATVAETENNTRIPERS